MIVEHILLIIFLAATVFVAAWLFIQVRLRAGVSKADYDALQETHNQVLRELAREQARALMLVQEQDRLQAQLQASGEQLAAARQDLAAVQTELHHRMETWEQREKEWLTSKEKYEKEFQQLANRIFEEKSQRFNQQSKEQLDALLSPLHTRIKEFEKRIEEGQRHESEQRISLREEVRQLAILNKRVSDEANNLVRALKGDTKKQGNWGEMILERILEQSGLRKDHEYRVQTSMKDAAGNRQQPDVVVEYPGDRQVVIDAKVNLVAYERFVVADDDKRRTDSLAAHVHALKKHIQQLSDKRYQDLYQLHTLDFVMLFIPIEPAYMAALQYDDTLWEYAYQRKILLISPTHLMASLKLIATMWRQEHQNQHVQEIARQSGALYDKFVGFVQDMKEVGARFESAEKAYHGAMNKLSEGKGNLVSRAHRIKALGAKTQKELPADLVARANNVLPDDD